METFWGHNWGLAGKIPGSQKRADRSDPVFKKKFLRRTPILTKVVGMTDELRRKRLKGKIYHKRKKKHSAKKKTSEVNWDGTEGKNLQNFDLFSCQVCLTWKGVKVWINELSRRTRET